MIRIYSCFLGLALLLSISSCSTSKLTVAQEQENFQAVKKVLFETRDAWNKGSLEEFMKGYLHSEELSFIGKSGVNKGWDTTLANYKRGYPDKEAMGKLSFDVIEMHALSESHCYMIGKYTLERKNDMPTGHFTLLWEKIDGQWYIISDHTSG